MEKTVWEHCRGWWKEKCTAFVRVTGKALLKGGYLAKT